MRLNFIDRDPYPNVLIFSFPNGLKFLKCYLLKIIFPSMCLIYLERYIDKLLFSFLYFFSSVSSDLLSSDSCPLDLNEGAFNIGLGLELFELFD